ncbi:MAG: hypothetical protein HY720_15750 [Planctomycetes bacterium]|nr:hypothetical protein [Planctomycetota bacterium]
MYWEAVEGAWNSHVEKRNDVTTIDGLPEGTHFEIYTLESLVRSHEKGDAYHRSEGCSRYVRQHRSEFQVEVLLPRPDCLRPDLRLTVDYPEDLVVCQRLYEVFRDRAPLVPLDEIVRFLDSRPDLKGLVAPYVDPKPLWLDAPLGGGPL